MRGERIVQAHERPPEQELHSDVTQVEESRRHITIWACMTQVFRQVYLPFIHIVDKGAELLVCSLGQADRTVKSWHQPRFSCELYTRLTCIRISRPAQGGLKA